MKPTRFLFAAFALAFVLFSTAHRARFYCVPAGQGASPSNASPDNPCYNTLTVSPQSAAAPSHQVAADAQGQAAGSDPPDTIDGAQHPELIPDDVAYRLIFLAVAEPENAPAARLALARAKIALVGLSADDTTAFLTHLTAFRKEFDAFNAQETALLQQNFAVHPLSTVAGQLRDIRTLRAKLFADTIAALPARLSDKGMAKLGAHLQHEKHAMKMFPSSYENGKPVY